MCATLAWHLCLRGLCGYAMIACLTGLRHGSRLCDVSRCVVQYAVCQGSIVEALASFDDAIVSNVHHGVQYVFSYGELRSHNKRL